MENSVASKSTNKRVEIAISFDVGERLPLESQVIKFSLFPSINFFTGGCESWVTLNYSRLG